MPNWYDSLVSAPPGTYLNPTGEPRRQLDTETNNMVKDHQALGRFLTDLMPPVQYSPYGLAKFAITNSIENKITGDNKKNKGAISPDDFTPTGLAQALFLSPLQQFADHQAELYRANHQSLPGPPSSVSNITKSSNWSLPNPMRRIEITPTPQRFQHGLPLPAARYLHQQMNPNPVPSYQPNLFMLGMS